MPADGMVIVLQCLGQRVKGARVTDLSEGFRGPAANQRVLVLQCDNQRFNGRRPDRRKGIDHGVSAEVAFILQCGEQRFDGTGIPDSSKGARRAAPHRRVFVLQQEDQPIEGGRTDLSEGAGRL